jgi:hypothetical protein
MIRPYAIEMDEPIPCEVCGTLNACRPFGPNAELVCYSCAIKDRAAFLRGFRRCFEKEGTA